MTPDKKAAITPTVPSCGRRSDNNTDYERVLCPNCGRLLGRRSKQATGVFQLKCARCSHHLQRSVVITYHFLVEIDDGDKVD